MYNVSIGYPRKPTICKKQWHFNTTFKAMWTATLHRCQKRPAEEIHQSSERPLTSQSLESNKAYASDFSKIRGEMMQSTWSNKSECLISFSEDFVQLKKEKKRKKKIKIMPRRSLHFNIGRWCSSKILLCLKQSLILVLETSVSVSQLSEQLLCYVN